MSVWSKIMTALRGSANEVGEAIADTQALRILDQEIRNAEEELRNSRDSLTEMMARKKVAEQKCTTMNAEISKFEEYAIQVLEQNDESLALDLAEKISGMERQRKTEQASYDDYTDNVNNLRNAIKQADSNIKNLKHQLNSVRATESVQRAQAAVAQRHSDSNVKLTTALDSLERIKEKQELKNARYDAAQELADDLANDSLTNKLEAAGIVSNETDGEAVLSRLKNKVTLRIESGKHLNEKN